MGEPEENPPPPKEEDEPAIGRELAAFWAEVLWNWAHGKPVP